ncbi:MAG: nickel-dependent hydrogenase large subunit [Thermoproteales archaeon]|nr:nickel-dependent hydrogenase large subunit [Thermoproteales archaeon]
MSIVTLPFGPQHPALEEPEHFRFKVDGEIIVDVEVRLGYLHRGIERLMTTKSYIQNIYLSERICGICNVAHTTCYTQTVEQLAGVEAPPRAQYLRLIVNELARIHSHLLIIGLAAEEIGFETMFMWIWRDREIVMRLMEELTGNRVMSGYNTIGGVRRDATEKFINMFKKKAPVLKESFEQIKKVFEEDPIVRKRFVDVGILKKADAISLSAVGPTARGSKVLIDVRYDDPYQAYKEIPINVITYDEGDSWARMMVRVDELFESLRLIEESIEKMPKGDYRKTFPRRLPEGESIGRVEAPRGELIYHLISKGGEKPFRIKIRTPTFSNLLPIATTFKGETIADIPAILISVDPCFCCTERIEIVDINKGKVWYTSRRELSRLYRRDQK